MSDYQHEHGKMLTNDFSISTFLTQLDLLLRPSSTIDSNLRTKIEHVLAVFEWDATTRSAPMCVQIWIPDFDAYRADAICRLLWDIKDKNQKKDEPEFYAFAQWIVQQYFRNQQSTFFSMTAQRIIQRIYDLYDKTFLPKSAFPLWNFVPDGWKPSDK